MTRWFEEALHEGLSFKIEATEVLYDSQTEHQRVVIFKNRALGLVMTLDDIVQTAQGDEFIYHEMLAHVPILAHGAVRKVLIVGGGDGGMLEEVLKHRAIERVTMVEIDESVVDLAKKYLRPICGDAFEDPRSELVIADGVDFVASTDARFDVIIIDSTDPIGPGEVLFDEAFYKSCRRCLETGGILVTQNGVPFLQGPELTATLACFRRNFADASCYLATVPTYFGGPMAFGWASDDPAPRHVALDRLQARLKAAGIATGYYTPEVHLGAFALPPYIAKLIA